MSAINWTVRELTKSAPSVNVRPGVKRDYYEFRQMNLDYANIYDGKLSDVKNPKQAFLSHIHTVRVIEVAGQIVGYYTLQRYENDKTKQSFTLLRDMYIKPEHRHNGYAKQARVHARSRDKILGIMISYSRARKCMDYFIQQGFDHVAHDVFEGNCEEHNLCHLICDPTEYQKIYYALPLSTFGIDTAKQMHAAYLKLRGIL